MWGSRLLLRLSSSTRSGGRAKSKVASFLFLLYQFCPSSGETELNVPITQQSIAQASYKDTYQCELLRKTVQIKKNKL